MRWDWWIYKDELLGLEVVKVRKIILWGVVFFEERVWGLSLERYISFLMLESDSWVLGWVEGRNLFVVDLG